jgi:hypothetical protein
MKKFLTSIIASALFTLLSLAVHAQQPVAKVNNPEIKKAFEFANANAVNETTTEKKHNYKINIKAVCDFAKSNPAITNESWEILKEGFVVRFISNDVNNMTYYDQKGNYKYSIQRYDETRLPRDIRATVKSHYYDYNISLVQEINTTSNQTQPIYIIHLRDAGSFKTIRFSNNELEEIAL